jgi:hypothetical protein
MHTLELVDKLDSEAVPATVYCSGLQWRHPEVDEDAVVVELLAVVRAEESNTFLVVVRS